MKLSVDSDVCTSIRLQTHPKKRQSRTMYVSCRSETIMLHKVGMAQGWLEERSVCRGQTTAIVIGRWCRCQHHQRLVFRPLIDLQTISQITLRHSHQIHRLAYILAGLFAFASPAYHLTTASTVSTHSATRDSTTVIT